MQQGDQNMSLVTVMEDKLLAVLGNVMGVFVGMGAVCFAIYGAYDIGQNIMSAVNAPPIIQIFATIFLSIKASLYGLMTWVIWRCAKFSFN